MCLFVVKIVFTSFWSLRNLKMIDDAYSSDTECGRNHWTVNPTKLSLARICLCSTLAMGQKLCQSFRPIFQPIQLQSSSPLWLHFIYTFTLWRKERGSDPREVSFRNYLTAKWISLCHERLWWQGHVPKWLKKKRLSYIVFSYSGKMAERPRIVLRSKRWVSG